jgi:uncharacterized membrane protein
MKTKLQLPLLLLAFVLLVVGYLFRILHWAGGNTLLTVSLVVLVAAVLPSLLRLWRSPGPRAARPRR